MRVLDSLAGVLKKGYPEYPVYIEPVSYTHLDVYKRQEYRVEYGGRVTSQKRVEENLRKNPELIIHFLNEFPETKQLVFNRLRKCGGVKFYRYLDMSNPVVQYVKKGLEDILKERDND